MLINQTDELLIQRCVDDELTPSEVRTLLQRLDRLDGAWKKLACELLEDRGMGKALRSMDGQSIVANPNAGLPAMPVRPASGGPSVIPPAAHVIRNWWSHPVTSLTLCAAIAFVGGMLIPDLNSLRLNSSVASSAALNPAQNSTTQRALNADGGRADSYRIQLGPGAQSVEIPVYSGIPDLMRSDSNHPLFSEYVQGADGRSHQIQWIVVPAGDKRSMLFPVSEDSLGEMQ